MLKGERWVPPDLEVAHLPHMMGHPYGGIFLFSQSARMMRPVRYWAGGGGLELIGTLEQATLDIHCPDGGAGGTPGVSFTHGELSPGEPCSHVLGQTSCHASSCHAEWLAVLLCAPETA
jgi:DNA-directed RNA polymerase I subunit RPA2